MVQPAEVYLIPLLPGKQALAVILGPTFPSCESGLEEMDVGICDCLVEGTPPTNLPRRLLQRYWCYSSFIEEGKWTLLWRGIPTRRTASRNGLISGQYDLFLDHLRQLLGFPRQKYTSASFTFSTYCRNCLERLYPGFARCPNCRAIRDEFRGLERFVVDQLGQCCLSGAMADVRDLDGSYYWAPYFIDALRAGIAGLIPDPEVGPGPRRDR
jgi:hypothetical protein